MFFLGFWVVASF